MDDASAGSVTVAERNLNLPPDVNLVSAPDLFSTRCADVIREYYRNGTKCPFPRLVCWLEIDPYLADILLDHTGGLSDDENVITFSQGLRLHQYLSHRDPVEPVGDLSAVNLLACGVAAIDIAPFSESGTLIVTVPEPSVEDF